MLLQGNIIEGDIDLSLKEFTLQRVKHLYTESVLTEAQVRSIYEYLKIHRDEDGQIITLYDQLPLRLSLEESNKLMADLEKVISFYH